MLTWQASVTITFANKMFVVFAINVKPANILCIKGLFSVPSTQLTVILNVPSNVCRSLPLSKSNKLMIPSIAPQAISLPSGLYKIRYDK